MIGILFGILLAGLGLWVIRLSRRDLRSDGSHDNSGPTRLTVGLVCLIWGYHAVVWSWPGWDPVSVPLNRWWIVVGVGVVALVGSLLAGWLERRT